MIESCPFCNMEALLNVAENPIGLAFPDAFPVAEGHTLVVPRQHLTSIFDLSDANQIQLWQIVA